MERTLVVGIGNDLRGDDAAGLAIARRVRAAGVQGIMVRESSGDLSALVDTWKGFDRVILADALAAAGEPGEVLRLDGRAACSLSPVFRCGISSHGIGVADAVRLAQELGRLPARVIVYGVVGSAFGLGDRISAGVERGIADAAAAIVRELA